MKKNNLVKRICVFAAFILCLPQIFCACCGYTNTEDKLLRIHVRADSDSVAAQSVKREVASAIDYYLSTELTGVETYDDMVREVRVRLESIRQIAAGILRGKGCGYGASAELTHQYFSERACGDKTVKAGYYDALIVRLGTGGGDNWWSVMYPQTYRVKTGADGLRYKSLIADFVRG